MTGAHDGLGHVLVVSDLGLVEQVPVRREGEGGRGVAEQAGHLMHPTPLGWWEAMHDEGAHVAWGLWAEGRP